MEVLRLVVIGLVGCTILLAGFAAGIRAQGPNDRERFDKLFAQGNYKDAYEGYKRLALNAKTKPNLVGTDLKKAIECLQYLGRADEGDAFIEAVLAVHKENWRLIQAAAETWLYDLQHFGFIVAGKFHRGPHRGGGRYVGTYERDRCRALQLLVQGLDRARSDPDRRAAGIYLLTLAHALIGNREESDPWRLQSKTPLDVLADYDQNPYAGMGGQQSAAPVEPDGTPVYYHVPASFAKAQNDGQRWRWALAQAAEIDPLLLNTTRSALARFVLSQFVSRRKSRFQRLAVARAQDADVNIRAFNFRKIGFLRIRVATPEFLEHDRAQAHGANAGSGGLPLRGQFRHHA